MTCALNFYSAFLLGLFSSLHCVGMCGGIVALFAGSMGTASKSAFEKIVLHFSFSMGRVFTYSLLGLLAGYFSYFLLNRFMPQLAPALRVFTGVLLVLFGLHLSGRILALNSLEKLGGPIWRFISPKLKNYLPVNNPLKAFSAGMIWGLLPCGMVYSSLLIAMTSSSWLESSSIMFGFGLGTVPMLVASGLAIQRVQSFLRHSTVKIGLSSLVIVYGIWIIASSWMDFHTIHFGHI